eukprot:CAMPEP_0206514338 /NCGR_PEP_ID=MMETSP0324_2-20121206/62059_1 /ASSEMBLY_ACC=CAM_ASM_000836 /TAXON_ID=2866 /ORGANISM="Crypthecodinium cohnii, Strain Seligo" /LENGTH=412 /DNA_ID=CAMNT_0054006755 /DNA_START=319 /DNA_END=1554 /DNA_ORIENTATION=+
MTRDAALPDRSDDAYLAFQMTAKGGGLLFNNTSNNNTNPTAATTSNNNSNSSSNSSNSNSNSNSSKIIINNNNDNNVNFEASTSQGSRAEAKRFICNDEGRALPIIMAGIYKGGSTTFWLDLLPALWNVSAEGAAIADCPYNPLHLCKEPNWFGRPESKYSFDTLWGRCTDDPPGVIMDFSTGTFYAFSAPARVKMVYKQKYQEVIFAWGFREPVNRTVSDYYYASRLQPNKTWANVSFPDHAQKILRTWSQTLHGSCENQSCLMGRGREGLLSAKSSFYYRYLRKWLDEGFRASQMVIYPGNLYMKHRDKLETNPVLQALRARVGQSTFNLSRAWRNGRAANKGSRAHVFPENATLVNEAKARLEEEIFAAENKKLFQLLAEEVGNGMTLVGYTGKANDVEAVEKWMTSDW